LKQVIAIGAALILLLTFPLQYALEQKNHHNISQFQLYVNISKEKARFEGCFTDEIIIELKTNILNEFNNIDEAEIHVDVTTTPKYRQNEFDEAELIHYRIGVPIKKLIATNLFWGIPDEDNQYLYIIENECSSERLMP